MQREIESFLQAFLKEPERSVTEAIDTTVRQSTGPGGLFSLGVIEESKAEKEPNKLATAPRSNVVEMPTSRFISSVYSSPTPKIHLTLDML